MSDKIQEIKNDTVYKTNLENEYKQLLESIWKYDNHSFESNFKSYFFNHALIRAGNELSSDLKFWANASIRLDKDYYKNLIHNSRNILLALSPSLTANFVYYDREFNWHIKDAKTTKSSTFSDIDSLKKDIATTENIPPDNIDIFIKEQWNSRNIALNWWAIPVNFYITKIWVNSYPDIKKSIVIIEVAEKVDNTDLNWDISLDRFGFDKYTRVQLEKVNQQFTLEEGFEPTLDSMFTKYNSDKEWRRVSNILSNKLGYKVWQETEAQKASILSYISLAILQNMSDRWHYKKSAMNAKQIAETVRKKYESASSTFDLFQTITGIEYDDFQALKISYESKIDSETEVFESEGYTVIFMQWLDNKVDTLFLAPWAKFETFAIAKQWDYFMIWNMWCVWNTGVWYTFKTQAELNSFMTQASQTLSKNSLWISAWAMWVTPWIWSSETRSVDVSKESYEQDIRIELAQEIINVPWWTSGVLHNLFRPSLDTSNQWGLYWSIVDFWNSDNPTPEEINAILAATDTYYNRHPEEYANLLQQVNLTMIDWWTKEDLQNMATEEVKEMKQELTIRLVAALWDFVSEVIKNTGVSEDATIWKPVYNITSEATYAFTWALSWPRETNSVDWWGDYDCTPECEEILFTTTPWYTLVYENLFETTPDYVISEEEWWGNWAPSTQSWSF